MAAPSELGVQALKRYKDSWTATGGWCSSFPSKPPTKFMCTRTPIGAAVSAQGSQRALDASGEAEFYGVVKAAGIALGYQALLDDLGVKLPVRVWTDSSATIGICGRQGLGKL